MLCLLHAGFACMHGVGVQGGLYRTKARGVKSPGGVSLVLGAGNQASVVSSDILFKLMHEDEVVIVKTNPVNEYIGRHLE